MNQNFHRHRPISDQDRPDRMETGWQGWFALLDRWEQIKRDLVSMINARLNHPRLIPVRVRVEIPPDRRDRLPRR